jgi:hypothetical protein
VIISIRNIAYSGSGRKTTFHLESAPGARLEIDPHACVTVREMREGPSEPACRSGLQTTLSCSGKEPG